MLDLTRRAAPAVPAENRPGSATIPSSAREWLLGLLEASKEVVVDAQLVINRGESATRTLSLRPSAVRRRSGFPADRLSG